MMPMPVINTHVVHSANGIVRIDNDAVLVADRSRLQFEAGRSVKRFRSAWHVVDVPDAFVEHLRMDASFRRETGEQIRIINYLNQ